MFARFPTSAIALIYAGFACAWIVLSGYAVDYLTTDPALHDSLEILKGILFVAVTTLLLFVLLRRQRRDLGGTLQDSEGRLPRRNLWIILLLSVVVVPTVGVSVYLVQRHGVEDQMLETLTSIAELKSRQVGRWVSERLDDGIEISSNVGLVGIIADLQVGYDKDKEARVQNRLDALRHANNYVAVVLYDATGRKMYSSGALDGGRSPEVERLLADPTLATTVMVDPYRDKDRRLHLEFVVPFRAKRNDTMVRIGTIVMHVDPERDVFPLLKFWPGRSDTSESNLVRPVGDGGVESLTQLRFPGALPQSRLPKSALTERARTALKDHAGGRERGTDYRGMEVFRAWRPVDGTDWIVVSKIDVAEAMAAPRDTALWITLITLLATAIVAGALVGYTRQVQVSRRLAAEAENDRLLRQFYELPFVGIAITNPKTKEWVQVNGYLCEMFGYAHDELIHKTWTELTHPDDLAKDVAEFDRVMRGESEGYAMEKRFIRKDGRVLFAEIDVKCLRDPDGSVALFAATVRDITQRREDQQRIARQSGFYTGLSACNAAIMQARDEEDLFNTVCRLAVESVGLHMAWIGLVDEHGELRVRSAFGSGLAYLEGIRVTVFADDPHGRGPSGTAIREDVPVWCDDFQTDERTAAWREKAKTFGWGAVAALPIHLDTKPVGSINLYSTENRSFDQDARRLLLDMSANISFALQNFRREALRREAEKSLAASEHRYRTLFANEHTVMLLIDPQRDGLIVDGNPAATKFYGWTREALCNMRIGDINVLSHEEIQAEMNAAAADRRNHFEFRHRRADGSVREVDVYSSAVTLGGRQLLYSIVHDVTERRLAEAKVQAYGRRAQALMDLPVDADNMDEKQLMQYGQELAEKLTDSRIAFIHLINEDQESIELVTWSQATLEHYCTAAFDKHYPISRAGIWADAFRRRAPVMFNDYDAYPDKKGLPPGHAHLGRLISVPVVESGKVRMLTGVGNKPEDYTEYDVETVQLVSDMIWHLVRQRRDAAALRTSEERYREIVERAPDMVFINRDDRIRYINPAGVHLLKAGSTAELTGKSVYELFDPAQHTLIAQRIAQLRNKPGTEIQAIPEILIARDGTKVEAEVGAISYESEGHVEIQVTCRDVTERRRAERQRDEAESKVRRYVEQLQSSLMHTVEVATTMSEMRDPYTAGHEKRVAEIAMAIAGAMGLDNYRIEGLRVAGYLHDIGKITIPSEILAKPGQLTEIERLMVQGHAQAGYDILRNVEFPWPVAEVTRQHHERIDGTGYPRGLKGEDILLEARILAVADVVEAMSSHRPYRPGLGVEKALANIEEGRGAKFDPQVVDACLRMFRQEGYKLPT